MSNCNIKKPQIASKCKRKLFPLINLQALKVNWKRLSLLSLRTSKGKQNLMIWILWRLNKKKKTHSKIFQILYFFKLQFHEFSTNTQNLNNDKVLQNMKTIYRVFIRWFQTLKNNNKTCVFWCCFSHGYIRVILETKIYIWK